MAESPVWFITGASSGFGTALVEAALKAGNRVIATARNPEKAAREHPQIEALGGKWLQLDVTAADVREKVEKVVHEHGKIDVAINNAGYSLLGAIEDMSESEIHQEFNTNVYGPIRVIQAVIPSMRTRKAGTIVNVGSIAGLHGRPACALYAGTKFALEGISECLAADVAPFNIRILLVEPGAFHTGFAAAVQKPAAGLTKDYEGTPLQTVVESLNPTGPRPRGDPVKAAARIIDVINGTGVGEGKTDLLRLPLGPDCMQRARTKVESLRTNLDAMEAIALSTDYD
ncbi:hypothetical protein FQN53_006192 [Emmonsiellopsis sp. PD_33]|nr:hypothetical protein FQN53_006192 [Emmonsiellopsis sp. PD_33]KAK2796738.1 hypothetical protein FQN51_009076 [Onygenales sp. PD_10]